MAASASEESVNSQASPLPPVSLPPISFALAVGQSPAGVKLYFHVIFAVGRSPDGDMHLVTLAGASSSAGLMWLALRQGLRPLDNRSG